MKKIKIIGIMIFIFLLALVIVSLNISENNKINNNLQTIINKQKSSTQEIAKNIFYIYRHKNSSLKRLNDSIVIFQDNLININSKLIKKQSDIFYLDVMKFKKQIKNTTAYTNIILEKTVKDIYMTNLILIKQF